MPEKKNAVVAPTSFRENRVILQAEYGLRSQNNGNNKRRSRFLFPMNIEAECYDSFAPLQMGGLPLSYIYIYIYRGGEGGRGRGNGVYFWVLDSESDFLA